ncbi:MAG: hypothetical protein AAGM22_24830 [Acidobacteriota bacterium]
MDLAPKGNERLQHHLRFLLRAYVVSWILAYLGVYRNEAVAHFLADGFLAGVHKMTAVWMLSGFIFVPIIAGYFLYRRALE